MKVGIVGLPNVGKSTLFKALTQKVVDINNYPFCTIEPNVGIVEVPDDRLTQLSTMASSQKVVPAVVEFVDIAGLVEGASKGEGLGNKFLSHIREVDAIVQVVRVFENTNITHVHDAVDPLRDIEIIETELMLADLETIGKTVTRLEKAARGADKDAPKQLEVVHLLKAGLEEGTLAHAVVTQQGEDFLRDEVRAAIIRDMALLTMKPLLYVYNVSGDGDPEAALLEALAARHHVCLDIKIEEELMEMSAEEAAELGMTSRRDVLITSAYALLRLQTFFTVGEKESRAWTIKQGSTAPQAGAAIHSDFQDKFICADVITWEKLVAQGSWSAAREAGAVQTVGKEHIMQDGDVVEFKHG